MHASRIVSFSTPGPFDWPPISTVPAQHIYRPFTAPIYSLFTVGGGDHFVRVLIILAILYSREDVVFMSRIWIGREGVTFREEGGRGFEEIGEGWMARLERLLEFNFNRYDRFWKLSMHRGERRVALNYWFDAWRD